MTGTETALSTERQKQTDAMATVPLLVFDLRVPLATWKLGSSNPQRALGVGADQIRGWRDDGTDSQRCSCPWMVMEGWKTAPLWTGN